MLTRPMRWFGDWGLPHLSDESLLELHALLIAGEHAVAARYLKHVKVCESCEARFDDVRESAAAAAPRRHCQRRCPHHARSASSGSSMS